MAGIIVINPKVIKGATPRISKGKQSIKVVPEIETNLIETKGIMAVLTSI